MSSELGRLRIVSSRSMNQGLGQMDIITDVFGFAKNLFSKDPNKVEYDKVRQEAFDHYGALLSQVEDAKASGTLTRTFLQQHIDALNALKDGFKAYTDKMRSQVDSSWLDPRFHDFYDPMTDAIRMWTQLLATLPADWSDYIPSVVTDLFGNKTDVMKFPITPVTQGSAAIAPVPSRASFDYTSMLLIGGAVLGLIFMSSRKRGF